MSSAAAKVSYPYIERNNTIRGGNPVVHGTRVLVATLVRAHQLGMDFEEILVQYPSITPTQLHAAFLYYHDHQDEIDASIAQDQAPPPGAVTLGKR